MSSSPLVRLGLTFHPPIIGPLVRRRDSSCNLEFYRYQRGLREEKGGKQG